MTLAHFFLVLKFILRQENALRTTTAQQLAAGPAAPAVVCPARPAILQYLLRARAPPADPRAPPADPPAPPADPPAPPADPHAPLVHPRAPVAAPRGATGAPATAPPGRLGYDYVGSYHNLVSDSGSSDDDCSSDGGPDSDVDVTMAAWSQV